MQKMLLVKETRECAPFALLALLAQWQILGAGMDLPLIPDFGILSSGRGQEIPFLATGRDLIGSRETRFLIVVVVAAIVIGLYQSIIESWRGTTLFLLHRPLPRVQIYWNKLLVGVGLLLLGAAVPLFVYSLWASTPGTHASPFYWGMMEPWWQDLIIGVVCYLAAFLTGLRTAPWITSRTWPLIAAVAVAICWKFVPIWLSMQYLGYALMVASLIFAILSTAQTREYP